ncbi:hypothetical protein NPS01_29840 [Nocardioides psychrotolerans]|uniref:DUF3592 domain-containing protein n=1 Tax=Nocardioides psychrotolerans TaxID=1005945 RepID=A0A1I3GJI8_9ACTN|nr:hypothetical protein [Nocardioides psychrotolerans]GEP39321.1 hypothetical protein NPS01_29840 [Nocardioides psychrotolerans]SFI23627.1 hypothetical protein SAMN05216561_106162 [Nocardioides psychrotolerans]
MRSRRQALLLLALLFVLVNLPLAHSTWTKSRVERSGVDVTAVVTDTREVTSDDETGYLVEFRFPTDVDPAQTLWTARIDAPTHDEAVETEQLAVRVLPDQPSAYVVQGQVSGRIGLWITVAADLFLLVMALLLARFRGRTAPALALVATEDLVRCKPGATLERLDGLTYVVEGEVLEISDDLVVLDLGDRLVRVHLDGHANPAGHQQPVRATGRMIG